MGPIALFDKSFLQSLTVDESVWFDHFFMVNIAPLFFVETLADLQKKVRPERTPEDEVRIIAEKIPEKSGNVNAFHKLICISNLLGKEVPRDGRIMMSGGRSGSYRDQKGLLFPVSLEMQAFERWRDGAFQEVEKLYASTWRKSINRDPGWDMVRETLSELNVNLEIIRNPTDAHKQAQAIAQGSTNFVKTLSLCLLVIGVSETDARRIFERWNDLKNPPLAIFAPYAAFVFTVDLFFYLSILRGFIAKERLSNRVDFAYFYYLPFCQIFISTDRLHRRYAPLFLRPDQEFIWGQDLKRDLGIINAYYKQLPITEQEQGIYKFAHHPPKEAPCVYRLWKCFYPGAQEKRGALPGMNADKEAEVVKEINAKVDALKNASNQLGSPEKPDYMIIERKVSKRKGSWWQMPKNMK